MDMLSTKHLKEKTENQYNITVVLQIDKQHILRLTIFFGMCITHVLFKSWGFYQHALNVCHGRIRLIWLQQPTAVFAFWCMSRGRKAKMILYWAKWPSMQWLGESRQHRNWKSEKAVPTDQCFSFLLHQLHIFSGWDFLTHGIWNYFK